MDDREGSFRVGEGDGEISAELLLRACIRGRVSDSRSFLYDGAEGGCETVAMFSLLFVT